MPLTQSLYTEGTVFTHTHTHTHTHTCTIYLFLSIRFCPVMTLNAEGRDTTVNVQLSFICSRPHRSQFKDKLLPV
jgi:hypothetical protein